MTWVARQRGSGDPELWAHLADQPKQMPRYLAHLNLFRPLGDAVTPVVAVDMLKRLVA